jgi:hypothetical protein
MKLTVAEFAPLFLEACPSARPRWEEYNLSYQGEPPNYYAECSEFSSHILDCWKNGQLEYLPGAFQVIERLVNEGDEDAQTLAVIGFMEGLQNVAGHAGIDYQVFVPYLGPGSLTAWNELIDFWNGTLVHVRQADA